jgi:hypothetical protein
VYLLEPVLPIRAPDASSDPASALLYQYGLEPIRHGGDETSLQR